MKKLLLASVLMLAAWPVNACADVAEVCRQECEGHAPGSTPEEDRVCHKECRERMCKDYGTCADEAPKPARFRFQPTQQVWQCNDLRVTWTNSAPDVFNYDISGTVIGGINLTATPKGLFLRSVPCVRLR